MEKKFPASAFGYLESPEFLTADHFSSKRVISHSEFGRPISLYVKRRTIADIIR